ncbi:MAG: hypothetical protein ACTSWN_14325 [Promethearchaeota archaeon]
MNVCIGVCFFGLSPIILFGSMTNLCIIHLFRGILESSLEVFIVFSWFWTGAALGRFHLLIFVHNSWPRDNWRQTSLKDVINN